MRDVKDEHWFWSDAGEWIGFMTVVGHTKFGHLRQEVNQVEPAAVVPGADRLLGNVMSAPPDSRAYTRDVKFGAAQPHIPDAYLDAF
jgi:transcriptional regulator of nitric oxide reductase